MSDTDFMDGGFGGGSRGGGGGSFGGSRGGETGGYRSGSASGETGSGKKNVSSSSETGSGRKNASGGSSETGSGKKNASGGNSETGSGKKNASGGSSETGSGRKNSETGGRKEGAELRTANAEKTNAVSNGELPRKGEISPKHTKEAIEQENAAVQARFKEFQAERWGAKPEMTPAESKEAQERLEAKQQILSSSMDLCRSKYEASVQIADKNAYLNTFSDHTQERHIPQVIEKTLQQADQNAQAARTDPKWAETYSPTYSENTLILAATAHDVGMAGKGTEQANPEAAYQARLSETKKAARDAGIRQSDADAEKALGNAIRKEHATESAMFILSRRDDIGQINKTIEARDGKNADLIDTDRAAMLVALHSKSGGMGESKVSVSDLSDSSKIVEYASALKQEAQSRGLAFDDGFLYKTDAQGRRVVDEAAVRTLATEASALRQGDSFRPSSDVQTTQSGKGMFIDATGVRADASTLEEEMADVKIGYADETGKLIDKSTILETDPQKNPELTKSRLDQNKSDIITKTYAVGEKNIRDITPGSVSEDGTLHTDVELRDGNLCPHATGRMIGERIAETSSATSDQELLSKCVYRIVTDEPVSSENQATIRHEITAFLNEKKGAGKETAGAFSITDADESEGGVQVEFVVRDKNGTVQPVADAPKTTKAAADVPKTTTKETVTDESDGTAVDKSAYDRTPVKTGKWVNEDGTQGKRGDSRFVPDDEYARETLKQYNADGVEYTDGYPDLTPFAAFTAYLAPDEYTLRDNTQFEICNGALYDAVVADPDTGEIADPHTAAQFSEGQLADIELGETPYGYTWHHDTEAGRMLLVPSDIHAACKHKGGRSIWGGGAQAR